jgi:hypothetical protein
MKAAIVGDIHLADRPPSIRTESYAEDILEKLSYIVQKTKELDCDVLVLNGDVFHIKSPSRNSHRLVQSTAEILTSVGIPVEIVPGNHDLSNDRLESLKSQPLGTLAKAKGINLLIGPQRDGLPLFGLPYLHDWVIELPKWMRKYTTWADQQKAEDFEFYPLMATHAPIFPVGEDPPYEYIGSDDWARMMINGDCTYGHIHDPHGAYCPVEDVAVTMINYGAISRGSLHEATLKREPAFGVWEGPGKVTRYPIPVRPVEAVFRMAEKVDVDEKQERAEQFLSAVGQTTLERLSIEEVIAKADAADLKPETRTLVKRLLEEAMAK